MCLRVRVAEEKGLGARGTSIPPSPESDGAERSPQVGPQNPRHTTWVGGGKSGPLRAASVRPPLALSRPAAMGACTHPLSRGPADLTVYTDWLSRICLPSRVEPVGLAGYTGSPVPSRGRESPARCSIREGCPILASSPGSTHTHTPLHPRASIFPGTSRAGRVVPAGISALGTGLLEPGCLGCPPMKGHPGRWGWPARPIRGSLLGGTSPANRGAGP